MTIINCLSAGSQNGRYKKIKHAKFSKNRTNGKFGVLIRVALPKNM